MIFKPELVALIRARRKTQTRRPVREHPEFGFEQKCRYKVGSVYRVQASRAWTASRLREHLAAVEASAPTRARAVVAYLTGPVEADWPARATTTDLEITVLSIRQERLGDLKDEDARREGFHFAAQFRAYWRRLHGTYDPDQLVWVITFGVGDLRDVFDTPRWLKAIPGADEAEHVLHQDYTDRVDLAMRGEKEALTRAQQEALSAVGRQRHLRRRADVAAELADRSSSARLAEIRWHRTIGR